MKEDQQMNSNQYDIVIIECCENCETHQNYSKHSEWKYFEQFNQLKRKIQKFIFNTIVIKNPVPDELIKTPQIKNQKNLFVNKESQQKIVFPRIGAFQIYMYNVLISSKLLTNQWPNHYKILQTLTKMIEEKNKGNSLDHFSVYHQGQGEETFPIQESKQMPIASQSPERKNVRISSKKKKGPHGLAAKAYKSIDKSHHQEAMKMTLDPVSTKLFSKQEVSPQRRRNIHRYLQSKADPRMRLPALSNTMANFKEDSELEPDQKQIFNTINQKPSQEISIIEKKDSDMEGSRKMSILDLKSDELKNHSVMSVKQQSLKFFEDHSVQYSEPEGKDIMNRSIQYEEQEGFYCDFGMQIDQDRLDKDRELGYQWVQTDKVQFKKDSKPYTFDDQVQVNIVFQKPCDTKFVQTPIKQFVESTVSTEMVVTINRQIQFPQEVSKMVNIDEVVDSNYQHLHEKRRNLIDSEDYYAIDRFEEKKSKYKWIGRATMSSSPDQLKKKMLLEAMVFSVYNYYGIKTPEKRLSYQLCSNVVGQKVREGLLHVLTFDNPELQYLNLFEDFDYDNKKFPLSEIITFKSSRQPIKFKNYGGFLALAYFLNDYEIYNPQNNQLGFVIVNQTVKQIHKLSALNYEIHPQTKSNQKEIIVNGDINTTIKIDRLSQEVELEFFSMLARICDENTLSELIKYIKQIFIHSASTYQQFKMTIQSLHLEGSFELTVEDFIRMLEHRVAKIKQIFKGKLYTYKKYHNLSPTIKYSFPFDHKIERKMHFKDKIVTVHDLVRHLKNNSSIVVIEGEEGTGKTTLLNEMLVQLKAADKINVMLIPWLKKEPLKIKEQLFQLSKNVLLIDNAQHFEAEVIETIDLLAKSNVEFSSCILTSNPQQIPVFKNRLNNYNLITTSLLPLSADQIKEYMMKVVKSKSYTDKKDLVETLVENKKYIKILQNPLYLSLYSNYVSSVDGSSYQPKDRELTQYSILKDSFLRCTTIHGDEMKQMNFEIKEALPNLRRLAFEYYHNGEEITQVIKEIVALYEENQLIRSQLAYYPVNLDSIVSVTYQPLFSHQLFLKFFLIEAYSYFVEKSFRNMRMEKLYNDVFLLKLITERYAIENTCSQLLEVVFSTKKIKNISQASSNAITLLGKMNYVFSNLNFDDCVIPMADLSNSIFYQCSFRGADLEQAILYKSQMISCVFDGASMSRINLFSRKYEIEFSAMTCSISVDNRRLAFGCGNYLIIINAETGNEIKRIEAHLDMIRLVKYTKDGNSLVTIADDKTLRIWDIYTYKSVVFKLPQKGSISYSNETQTIASVNKNTLKVWNLKSMANQAELEGHTEAITTIEFSSDGQLILTGSRDSTLRLWTLKGKQKVIFKGHDEQILVGKLSPSKRTMVSSSRAKDMIMWQMQSGTKLTSKKFMSEITDICLDNKEKYILVTFSNDNHIVVIDFLTLDIIHALSGHEAKIMSLSFDHNYQQLVSLGKDRTARVWQFDRIIQNEIRYPKITKKIKKGPILALAYDKARSLYVTSHENGELNIWNSEDNTLKDQLMSHNGPVRCLAIDRSSKIYSGGSDGALRIWNLDSRREPKTIEIHSSEMIQLKLSEKNRLIATSSTNNQLVIYDFSGIKIVMSTRQEGRVNAISFSLDEKLMAVGGNEKYVVIYEVINSSSVNRTQELGQHSDAISSMTFFSDFLLVVALKNGQVSIWNHHRANLIKKIENVSPIRSLMQFQKKYIVFTSDDGKIRIVNMDEGRQVRVFRYSQTPTTIDMNEDESILVAGTTGGNIVKWNLNCVRPPNKTIQFDRKAIDQECTRLVTVQSGRSLLIKDLFYHRQSIVDVNVDSDIEGVTFDGDKIILLLKNGKYWQYGKRQYKFNTVHYYEGDLHSIRDKHITNFFKSGLKKIKGMNKPSLSILEEVNHI